jgi:hypothetical protein
VYVRERERERERERAVVNEGHPRFGEIKEGGREK